MKLKFYLTISLIGVLLLIPGAAAYAADVLKPDHAFNTGACIIIAVTIFLLLLLLLWLIRLARGLKEDEVAQEKYGDKWIFRQINSLDAPQLDQLISRRNHRKKAIGKAKGGNNGFTAVMLLMLVFSGLAVQAQTAAESKNVLISPGMIIMLTLIFIPLVVIVFLVTLKIRNLAVKTRYSRVKKETTELVKAIDDDDAVYEELIKRKHALNYRLTNNELAGTIEAEDSKGILLNVDEVHGPRFFASKRKAAPKHQTDPKLVKLIMWYLGSAAFWLVLGTSVGEYIGIKFVSPDADHISWLSFGRLRPVHTNMVFWGWSSMAMLGLGYYVVTTVSNTVVYSIKWGYYSLILMNAAIITGSGMLMAGINNGGGEYREYIWPVMTLFAGGIVLSLANYIKTIAQRKTREIYISNWYIVSAMMFLTVIVTVGYLPFYQNGLGETIVQGYYMHQAVGMWFMFFNLGLVYYFLPQQLNTPIYSYSLGILAFWSQILFYTLIGTHHFIFSSIPWWLQTVAIVGSMGMLIPVFSGTTNFIMTFRGNFNKIGRSYTLPFYIVGILFYFTGSTQGTAEAFRETNLIWHFTDFTVAHSHLTMYGIIAFMLWACIYTIVPRLTGNEPKQGLVGAHFWLALIGLLFYTIPLMVGGTLKGIAWRDGKPFIDGVVLMTPYWLWRAIGGSLMWASHLVFAWNMYVMFSGHKSHPDIRKEVFEKLNTIPFNAEI
ncbi:cbb3-type cytochrome c oxidase subunit I [Mucilaginibacter sp. P19]|uniref:Cytochrome c oxidase cbb3-type subunit 1 n=1 Tax=Mucilaginibacter gossypii TaxID=551996 RepID=A0A1G8NCH5_9SPHI|nr:cbb3-type cytochrome c oxidase subunit I [Mucilaginibacter gossypii]SDI77848.1 cytochrome c oxidase cbb3-type subunit 1 [Mucilaginibacter gossypii]